MVNERPSKLPPSALLVLWGAKRLTMCEKVVSYHDWTLDQGGADGSYISPESLSRRLGGEYAPSTIAQSRAHLRRLGLRVALKRRDARNLGWVVTLPDACRPHAAREAGELAAVLDNHIDQREAWLAKQPPAVAQTNGQPLPRPTASRESLATATGGQGGASALESALQAQLPSAFREKGVASDEAERREERDAAEVRAEGWALIHLEQGKMLTETEKALVRAWLARNPAAATSERARRASA